MAVISPSPDSASHSWIGDCTYFQSLATGGFGLAAQVGWQSRVGPGVAKVVQSVWTHGEMLVQLDATIHRGGGLSEIVVTQTLDVPIGSPLVCSQLPKNSFSYRSFPFAYLEYKHDQATAYRSFGTWSSSSEITMPYSGTLSVDGKFM